MRKTEFANDEYYHIFNRGVDKREVFSSARDYERFLLAMDLLNDSEDGLMIKWRDYKKTNLEATIDDFLKLNFSKKDSLVEIIAYCLNPNHFHFLVRQVKDRGVEKFMHKIGTSYTKYFNKKNKRSGALFQGRFKSVHIDSNEYLLYLSAYINKNNFIHGYNKDDDWKYTSLHAYLGKIEDKLICKDAVSRQFSSTQECKEFFNENALHMREKKESEKYLIEE